MSARRLKTAQALVEFLAVQYTERAGEEQRLFAGVFGIFGHGSVAGMGQALQPIGQERLPYYQGRNEQAMAHAAAAFAKMRNRLSTLVCTSSVGPGATNMITGAAGATINRLPVLLLPGDLFARRHVAPLLQQLEDPRSQDISVNDAFRPVSRYWDRINRPEQLPSALFAATRVLTDAAETGAVTLALPQDVQAEAWDFPEALFQRRVWEIPRPLPPARSIDHAAALIAGAQRPLLISGGGATYAGASAALQAFANATGIPVAETQAGKGALRWDHAAAVGGVGVTGTPLANRLAREADVVIGVGTHYSDFPTASRTAFANPTVRFVNINIAAFDAGKQNAGGLVGDARATLEALQAALPGYHMPAAYAETVRRGREDWDAAVAELTSADQDPPVHQAGVIGAVQDVADARDVIVAAAGSLPRDLHKLWQARDAKSYHMEYGYSCMGYEVAGGVGVRLAAPDRDVFVLLGEASWLMMSSEIVTAVQDGLKLTMVLLDNHGHASIGGLSTSVGSAGFGTEYRARSTAGKLDGDPLPLDFVANAASLGARAVRARTIRDLRAALAAAKAGTETTVIVIETDREARVPGDGSWWDVPVAEVSTMPAVQTARRAYEAAGRAQRPLP